MVTNKQETRKPYTRVPLPCLIAWLKDLLPVPGVGHQGWRRLPVVKWAEKLGISRMSLYRWLRTLEAAGYLQYENYPGSSK